MANLVNTTITGNVIVTQNTSTGNLSISTLANVATLNITGQMSANASPLTNVATRPATILSGYHTVASSCTASAVLQSDAYLTLTFNETGSYDFDALMLVAGNTGSNGFGGFQFDLGIPGAVLANLAYAITGFSNAAIAAAAAVTVNNTVYSTSNVASSNTTPSWFRLNGTVTVTGVGNWGVRWAQGVSSPNAITMMQGSYIKAIKHR